MGESCDENEGRKGSQESTETINTRNKTSWKSQRERLGAMDKDAKRMLKCRNWRMSAENRDAWRPRIEEAKVQLGLYRHRSRIKRTSYPHILYFECGLILAPVILESISCYFPNTIVLKCLIT